jgi:hypothetical protein
MRVISYQEWSRDWPDDTQQPALYAVVLNPAGVFLADERELSDQAPFVRRGFLIR